MLSVWRAVAIGVLGIAAVSLGEHVSGGSTLGSSSTTQQGRAHAEQPLQLQTSPRRGLIIGGERTGGRRYPFLVHWDVLAEEAASVRASCRREGSYFPFDGVVDFSLRFLSCLTRCSSPADARDVPVNSQNFIRASGHGVMITDDVFLTLRAFRFGTMKKGGGCVGQPRRCLALADAPPPGRIGDRASPGP